jgi:hypothetical protein
MAQGGDAFYRLDIKSHRAESVASLAGVKSPPAATFGDWTGLAPMILRGALTTKVFISQRPSAK